MIDVRRTRLNREKRGRAAIKWGSLFIVSTPLAIALVPLVITVQADPLTVSKVVSPKQQVAAAAHWTRARIAAAPAIHLPIDRSPAGIDAAAAFQVPVSGPVGSSAPGKAEPGATGFAR